MSFLRKTQSLCPQCLKVIDAHYVQEIIAEQEWVYLKKVCSEHGSFSTPIWVNLLNVPHFNEWYSKSIPHYVNLPHTAQDKGCPYDCGLCPKHTSHTCCALLEVTKRCNLQCPICYATSHNTHDDNAKDCDLAKISTSLQQLLQHAGNVNVQISGGEPTIRDDLEDIIQLVNNTGFSFVQLNTNGIRLSTEYNYAQKLKNAGLNLVYLQWDDVCDESYIKIRGKACADIKEKALANCLAAQLPVVLVCTIIKGINHKSLGNIITQALKDGPLVRGVHIQPVSSFGRYPWLGDHAPRMTIPEILYELEVQTHGMLKAKHFTAPKSEHALCSFNAVYTRKQENLVPTNINTNCCTNAIPAKKAQEFVAKHWGALPSKHSPENDFNTAINELQHRFTISGMAFQDVYNIDLERLRQCHIHIISEDDHLIPFCAYNLTSETNFALYRKA